MLAQTLLFKSRVLPSHHPIARQGIHARGEFGLAKINAKSRFT